MSVTISCGAFSNNLYTVTSFCTRRPSFRQGFLRAKHQKLVSNSLEYPHHNINEMLPVPSMISVVGSTSYEQGSTDAGTDSSSARAGRDTWLELSPEPRGCPFSKAPSSFGMESSPSVSSRRKEEWQKKRHK